jgi:hypothetical protein
MARIPLRFWLIGLLPLLVFLCRVPFPGDDTQSRRAYARFATNPSAENKATWEAELARIRKLGERWFYGSRALVGVDLVLICWLFLRRSSPSPDEQ